MKMTFDNTSKNNPIQDVDKYSRLAILSEVTDFLETMPEEDAARVTWHIHSLLTDKREGLQIKSLKGKVRELVVQKYRVIFFEVDGMTYIITVFKKQSLKTPLRIIQRAGKIYQDIINKQNYEKEK